MCMCVCSLEYSILTMCVCACTCANVRVSVRVYVHVHMCVRAWDYFTKQRITHLIVSLALIFIRGSGCAAPISAPLGLINAERSITSHAAGQRLRASTGGAAEQDSRAN